MNLLARFRKQLKVSRVYAYAVYEKGKLLGLCPSLAAASVLQGNFPFADLLLVEIDATVWEYLEKRTEETIDELSR